jgi:hypothetical protein
MPFQASILLAIGAGGLHGASSGCIKLADKNLEGQKLKTIFFDQTDGDEGEERFYNIDTNSAAPQRPAKKKIYLRLETKL